MFERIPEYYKDAKASERIFREILNDITTFVDFAPSKLDLPSNIDALLATYSPVNPEQRKGKFIVLDFRRGPYQSPTVNLKENEAMLTIQNLSILSGNGAILRYAIKGDQITYIEKIAKWKS